MNTIVLPFSQRVGGEFYLAKELPQQENVKRWIQAMLRTEGYKEPVYSCFHPLGEPIIYDFFAQTTNGAIILEKKNGVEEISSFPSSEWMDGLQQCIMTTMYWYWAEDMQGREYVLLDFSILTLNEETKDRNCPLIPSCF